jgi:hypothetical protein
MAPSKGTVKKPTLKQQHKTLLNFEGHSPQPQQFDAGAQAWTSESVEATQQAKKLWEVYLSENIEEFFRLIGSEPPTALVLHRLLLLAHWSDNPDKPSQLGKAKSAALAQKLAPLKILLLEEWAKNKVAPKKKNMDDFANDFHESEHAKSLGASLTWIRKCLRNQ